MYNYYYHYYAEASKIPDVQEAFERVCVCKMLRDGYFDMSQYIRGNLTKGNMYRTLVEIKSPYAPLYYDKNTFPHTDNIVERWCNVLNCASVNRPTTIRENMSEIEVEAIVYWVYAALKTKKEKEQFTKDVFSKIKDLASIQHAIKFKKSIVYNAEKVDVHIFDSLPKIIEFVTNTIAPGETVFYRGHSSANYRLLPSIMRTSELKKGENRLYQEIQIRCPEEFLTCHSHLEKLVKMQHYGLPTRLLDITRNLLVAVYFACESHFDSYGEVILLATRDEAVKYPTSDIVTILASLAALRYDDKQQISNWINNPLITEMEFNQKISGLIQEIHLEKPAFIPEIQKDDVQQNLIVCATKDNKRIVQQNGAFIICGLLKDKVGLEEFRYRSNEKKILLFVEKKRQILKELEACSISKATLFPEIERVSEYLKSAYIR